MTQHATTTKMSTQLVPLVSTWILGEVRENLENCQVKTFPLAAGGSDIILVMSGVISPFELSSVSEGNARKSLTLRLPKAWDGEITCMEACVQKEMWERYARTIYNRDMQYEEFEALYKGISQQTGNYPRHLRVKVNTAGFHACRYWDSQRQHIPALDAHINYVFNARVQVRALWVGPDGWGLVIDATDLQVQDIPMEECPF